MKYLKKQNMICFEIDELANFFKNTKRKEIEQKIKESGCSVEELSKDLQKSQELIIDKVHSNMGKEDVEIIIALSSCSSFYGENSKICFELGRGINIENEKVEDMDDLKRVVEERALVDFASIDEKDDLRKFQLKQYKEELKTNDVFGFIKEKVLHYGNDLGNVNLFVVLQGNGNNVMDIDWEVLNKKIVDEGFSFEGEILLKYNDNNTHHKIIKVYPDVAESKRDFKLFSESF